MSEPDHIIVKPIPNLARDGLAAAFPFFYIEPKKYESILRKFYPEEKGPITYIDPIGNSPVIVARVCIFKQDKKILILCLGPLGIWHLKILFFKLLGFSQEDSSYLDERFSGNEERS